MTLSERRANRERYYQRAKRWVESWVPDLEGKRKAVFVGRVAATRRYCSCAMCKRGEPVARKVDKIKTADELRDA